MRLAAEKAGWGRKLPKGHGLGLAFYFSHFGYVAEVAEVSLENGIPRVHRVVAAVDCGRVVNAMLAGRYQIVDKPAPREPRSQ